MEQVASTVRQDQHQAMVASVVTGRWTGSWQLHTQLTTQIRDRQKVVDNLRDRLAALKASASLVDFERREAEVERLLLTAVTRLENVQALYDSKVVPYEDGEETEWTPYKD